MQKKLQGTTQEIMREIQKELGKCVCKKLAGNWKESMKERQQGHRKKSMQKTAKNQARKYVRKGAKKQAKMYAGKVAMNQASVSAKTKQGTRQEIM